MAEEEHEIVINSPHGGFFLNGKVVRRLAKLGCKVAQKSIQQKDEELAKRTEEDIEFDKMYPNPDPYTAIIHKDDRMNPLLIQAVKELGDEAGNLKVVTFKGNKYVIREYDGAEWIVTPDKIKWNTVE